VGDAAEELEGVAFFLEWIGFVGRADEGEGSGVDFPLLFGALTGDELAGDGDGSAGGHFVEVIGAGDAGVGDDLDAFEAGAVVEFEEGEGFGVAAGADPTGEEDGVVR
jgi:hypothetical protein